MLRTQVIEDQQGVPMGVFIPMQAWDSVRKIYPDIENMDMDIPQWEKDFIDKRLSVISQNPERLHPIDTLFNDL